VRGSEGKQKPGFPKGKIEPVDASILAAALRETWEEAGLANDAVRVLPSRAEAAANATAARDAAQSRVFAADDEVLLDAAGVKAAAADAAAAAASRSGAEARAAAEEEANDGEPDGDEGFPERDVLDDRLYASVDVREVTGRAGKRARYFVCGVDEDRRALTAVHDVDGDIADVAWVDVNDALVLLERKRRAALRRAVLIFAANERDADPGGLPGGKAVRAAVDAGAPEAPPLV